MSGVVVDTPGPSQAAHRGARPINRCRSAQIELQPPAEPSDRRPRSRRRAPPTAAACVRPSARHAMAGSVHARTVGPWGTAWRDPHPRSRPCV